jgi:ADP-heptose:LPS heptosyltransferase
VSLQVGPTSAAAAQLGLPDLAAHLPDFAETAALMSCLDQVVSVDTSTAHLAGALGVPTAVLLPYASDWRWMHGRQDTPWYASTKLFRQDQPRDWNGAVAAVTRALAARFGARVSAA